MLSKILGLLSVLSMVSLVHAGPEYDLVLRDGKIIDGQGNAWFYGDVAVKDGRIAFVGTLPGGSTAKQELSATGLVIAPGFIDVHTHADEDLYTQPLADNFIRDGVTTIITGNCGGSPGHIGAYLDHLKSHGTAVNVGVLYGHNTVLRAVKGDRAGELTPEQMEKAKGLVAKAMEEGAVGFSTGLIYRPGTYSKPEEIIELQKVAASYGGIYATHMRNEGMGVVDAIHEALRVGREAHCRVEISHFKISTDASKKIGGSDVTIGLVSAARAAGQEVWLDQYPYAASSTTISTLIPDDFLADGDKVAHDKLADPGVEDRVVEQMRHTYEDERHRQSMAYVVVASCRTKAYEGRNLLEIAQMIQRGKRDKGKELLADSATAPVAEEPPVTIADQCRAAIDIWKDGGASCVFHSMDESDVGNIMKQPLVSIASDSGVRVFGSGMPHPRGYGTNTRVLGRYVRELKLIGLEDAIRKMTSQPATAFRLADRGVIRAGAFADLTIFDPAMVADKATFEKPHQYPVGIAYVVVNGQVVLAKDQMTGKLPGMPLYGPGKKAEPTAIAH